jgi:hypothetical protein
LRPRRKGLRNFAGSRETGRQAVSKRLGKVLNGLVPLMELLGNKSGLDLGEVLEDVVSFQEEIDMAGGET